MIHIMFQEDFFTELHNMLAEMPEVTELHPVADAHVPVMKFCFNGVSIDLLYAKLALWVIPEVSSVFPLFCIYFIMRVLNVSPSYHPHNATESFCLKIFIELLYEHVNPVQSLVLLVLFYT